MCNVTCADCEEYKNEWCEKIIDSPCPDLIRDCQYFHEKDRDLVRVVRCKDCKHFELDKPYVIQGIPLLGHEVCNAWGDGCKTDQDGFCFMGERRTDGEAV